MDITDADETPARVIEDSGAEAVIHCAAYTAVDAAEDHVELCRRVNVDGTANIARGLRGKESEDDLYQHGLCI